MLPIYEHLREAGSKQIKEKVPWLKIVDLDRGNEKRGYAHAQV